MAELATVDDIENAWRPLSDFEKTRAAYWIAAASRALYRKWKDLDDRILNEQVGKADVADIVVAMVLEILPSMETNGLKSLAIASGAESKAITVDTASRDDRLKIADWMIEIIEGQAVPVAMPQIAAPRPYGLNGIFPAWKEVYE